jgi:hypothetical protein
MTIPVLALALVGCSSSIQSQGEPVPEGCLAEPEEISEALVHQQDWLLDGRPVRIPGQTLLENALFYPDAVGVLEHPECFHPKFVLGYEILWNARANWESNPSYDSESSLLFLPTGEIVDSVPAQEIDLTNDPAQLRRVFESFEVEESDGSTWDYEVDLETVRAIYEMGKNSNRERDKRIFLLEFQLQMRVDMEGTPSLQVMQVFTGSPKSGSPEFPILEANCNGTLVEADGEAIRILSKRACGNAERVDIIGYVFDLGPNLSHIESLGNTEELAHALKVMAKGRSAIHMIDTEGNRLKFQFGKTQARQIEKALTAVKAVQLGFGY